MKRKKKQEPRFLVTEKFKQSGKTKTYVGNHYSLSYEDGHYALQCVPLNRKALRTALKLEGLDDSGVTSKKSGTRKLHAKKKEMDIQRCKDKKNKKNQWKQKKIYQALMFTQLPKDEIDKLLSSIDWENSKGRKRMARKELQKKEVEPKVVSLFAPRPKLILCKTRTREFGSLRWRKV